MSQFYLKKKKWTLQKCKILNETGAFTSQLTISVKFLPVSTSHFLIEWSHDAEYIDSRCGQTTEDTHCVWPTRVVKASPYNTTDENLFVRYQRKLKTTDELICQMSMKTKDGYVKR